MFPQCHLIQIYCLVLFLYCQILRKRSVFAGFYASIEDEGPSWHWAVLLRGRDDTGKLKLFLPSSMLLFSDFFAAVVCWNFSSGLLDSYKGTLSYGWFLKSVLYGAGDGLKKLLSCCYHSLEYIFWISILKWWLE